MYDFRLILIATIFFVSLILAVFHGARWEKRYPEKMGFTWGYFVIYNALINNLVIFGAATAVSADDGDIGAMIVSLFLLAFACTAAYLAIKRRKWALITSTLLSLNLFWIFINFFYLKNRWDEFSSERPSRNDSRLGSTFKSMEKDTRVAIFVSICWVVCVPLYVFLFEPYGRYMADSDFGHMFGTMFFPITIGMGLFFIYKKFVR